MALFTLFVVLPSEEVCSLRNVTSGASVGDIQCRLEMAAGLPAQIYKLIGNNGQVLHEEHVLELGKNVWDGILMRVQLLGSWQLLYDAVIRGDLGRLLRSGAVHPKQGVMLEEDGQPDPSVSETVEERGCVALYLACWMGAIKICQGLLSIGVNPNGTTPFHRTPIFAAVIRDNDRVLETLLTHGAKLSVRDCLGDTPIDVAKRSFSRQCVNRIRSFQLVMRGHLSRTSRSKSPSEISIGSFPRSTSNDRLSVDASIVSTPRNRPFTAKLKQQTAKERPQTAIVYKTKSNFDIHLHPRSISRESGRDRPQIRVANGMVRPIYLDLGFHQPSLQARGPSSITSSPRGSIVTVDHGGNTPRISNGATLRVALSKKNDSVSKKSHNVVTWNDPLTESERLRVRSPNREGRLQLQSHSSSYSNNVNAPSVTWNLTEPTKNKAISCDEQPESPLKNVNESSHDFIIPEKDEDQTESVTLKANSDGQSVEDKPDVEDGNNENQENEGPKEDKQEARVRFTQRSVGFRHRPKSKHKQGESLTTAKRRIQLAEQQKRAQTANLKRKETFEQWLEKKRSQERQTRDDGETDESSSGEEQDPQAFQDWLKEIRERPKNQPNPNSAVSLHHRKTRAIKGLVGIESPVPDQPVTTVDTSSYMHALDDWREKRQKVREKMSAAPTDAKEAKKRLEEKRQELLAMAITFDEWMEHTEERKQLTKIILHADGEKLSEIERSKFPQRSGKAISFERWRQKLNERETQERVQRLLMRKEYEFEQPTKIAPKKRYVSFER